MENLVFTTFTDEKNATDGLKKIQELDQIGDIIIYNIALVKKNSDNKLIILHHEGPDVSALPAEGAIAGSLIGLLAGPVGMAIGMLTGIVAGAADEDEAGEVTQQVLDKAGIQLTSGSFAIIIDVQEDTTFLIDSYMVPLKGKTIHTPITDEYDQNASEQWEKLNTEIDEAEMALKTAVSKDKEDLKATIDDLKKKRAKLKEQIKEKASKKKKQWQNKIRIMETKISHAKDNTREKLKKQHEKLLADLDNYNETVAYAFD